MAGDRKIGDIAIAFFIFCACLSAFIMLIVGFDDATNNSEVIGARLLYSSNMSNIVGNETVIDISTSVQLQSVTFNNNTFQAPTGQFIDTRGVSQGNIIANNYPSTLSHFFSGISNLFSFKGSGIIFYLIISLIGLTAIILIIRFFQGSIKV